MLAALPLPHAPHLGAFWSTCIAVDFGRAGAAVTTTRTILVLGLLFLLPAATCGTQYRMPPCSQRTVALAPELPAGLRRLEIQFHDGLLALQPGDAPKCTLEAHLQADDEATLKEYEQQTTAALDYDAKSGIASLRVNWPAGADLEALRTTWRVMAPKGLEVVVTTRRGGVVARGTECALVVKGGSGVIEAELAGGSADLETTSGSLILRGDYDRANVKSGLGRIDLGLPLTRSTPSRLEASSEKGDVYVDIRKDQAWDLWFYGEPRWVRCDPEVRAEWHDPETVDGVTWARGRVGALGQPASGALWLGANAPVSMRLLPERPFANAQPRANAGVGVTSAPAAPAR